jgi:hypothetical protein
MCFHHTYSYKGVAMEINRVHHLWMDEKQHQHEITIIVENWIHWSCTTIVLT